MNLKRGFTLAEVLVALAIVGILAAVTLPAIQASLKKSAVGPSLMKIIGNLENANRLILQEKDTDSLSSLCGNNYLGCISKKASLSKLYNQNEGPTFNEDFDGTNSKKYSYKGPVYVSDDGVTYANYQYEGVHTSSNGIANNLKDKYEGNYYLILVDINGIKGSPNVMGKDIFSLMVDGSGIVLAQGSREYVSYNELNSDNKKNYWANEGKCENGKKPTSNNGRLCSGSVIDNGGKVLYKY